MIIEQPTTPRTLPPLRLWHGRVQTTWRTDGSCLVRPADLLAPYPDFLTSRLEQWARAVPDRVFLTQPASDGTRRPITYGETLRQVRAIGQALVERDLNAARPVAILAENSIEFALLTLACLYAGVPVVPISPAYALISSDYGRLRHVMESLNPGLILAAHAAFAAGIAATAPASAEIVMITGTMPDRASTPFSALTSRVPGAALDRAHAARAPDDVAKLLFTSGSTGIPKGVINTHRMLSANQQMIAQSFEFLQDEPPVIVDWLPWHHTFGGNHNFGIALYNGGTFHIDEGRPTTAGFTRTAETLRMLAPSLYFNVPRGFDMLLSAMAQDGHLAENFFSRLHMMFCAGAALSPPVWQGLRETSKRICGRHVPVLTGLGSTETGPFALTVVREADRAGEIGVPVPGVELKLAPIGRKMEVRLRGPAITPGYWQRPDAARDAFDEEGFYRMGDAAYFKNPADPSEGLMFNGRIAEDFKLATGVWVNVANVRARVLTALMPLVVDAFVVGQDRDEVGILVIPDPTACRALLPEGAVIWDNAEISRVLLERLKQAGGGGSSERVTRIGVLRRPLSLDAGEITDKGSVNARQLAETRARLVDAMYQHEKIVWEQAE